MVKSPSNPPKGSEVRLLRNGEAKRPEGLRRSVHDTRGFEMEFEGGTTLEQEHLENSWKHMNIWEDDETQGAENLGCC